jgi:hypothetical protein
MGQHDNERWRIEHDIKITKEEDNGLNPFIVILMIAVILGILFSH